MAGRLVQLTLTRLIDVSVIEKLPDIDESPFKGVVLSRTRIQLYSFAHVELLKWAWK